MKITEAITGLNNEAELIVLPPHDESDIAKVMAYWGLIRIALQLVMIFTGAKADKRIKEIIAIGDGLSGRVG